MKLLNLFYILMFSGLLLSCSDDDGKYVQADPDAKYYVEGDEEKLNLSTSYMSIGDNIYVEIHLSSGVTHKFNFSGNSQGNVTNRFIDAELSDFADSGSVITVKSGKITFNKEFGLGGIIFEDVVFQTTTDTGSTREIEISGYAYLSRAD